MTTEVDGGAQLASSFLKRVLMRLLLVLVGASVVIAIVQVLQGVPLGETFGRMIWTSVAAGIYGLLAVACVNAAEQKPTLFAYAGVACAVVTIAIVFVGIW